MQPTQSQAPRAGGRPILYVGAALFALATTALLVSRWLTNDDLTTEASFSVLPVETTSITPVDGVAMNRFYSGRIEARRSSDLAFEASARIASILISEGAGVSRGQALARLDARRLQLQIDQAEAQLRQAQARLNELRAGPRTETIDAVRARLDEARQQLELSRIQTARREELLARQAISQEEFDQLNYRTRSVEAAFNSLAAQLKEVETGTRREQIVGQEAIVAELESRVGALKLDLAKATLRAPFAGVVSERFLDEGVVVAPGQAVLRLVESSSPEARIGVPAAVASGLQIGRQLTVESLGAEYPARVTGILPELESATRTATVVLAVDAEPGASIIPGQVARIALESQDDVSGFWLPVGALTPGVRGLWSCLALVAAEPDLSAAGPLFELETRQVEILHTEGERVLVRGALQPGDEIVSNGSNRVTAGQLVQRKS